MTRITNTAIETTQAIENQNSVTVGSLGQQELRQGANEELYAFYAMLIGAAKQTATSAIARLQAKLFEVGLRSPM